METTGAVQQYFVNYHMQVQTGSFKAVMQSGKESQKADLGSVLVNFKLQTFSFSLSTINEQKALFDESNAAELPPEGDTATDPVQDLFGEDGYWGVKKTSGRIADFVLSAAGDDLEKLRAGRQGILAGFKEAKQIMNGNLPDISHDTIDSALASIDEKIRSLGGSALDISA